MKTKRLFISLLACVVLLTGCSKSNGSDDGTPTEYTVSVTGGEHGIVQAMVDGASVTIAEVGTTVTLTAAPDEGYKFGGWTVVSGGITLSPDAQTNPATFTMPAGDVAVEATFVEQATVFYVAGIEGNYPNGVAKVWKNGAELSALTDGTLHAGGYSIALNGSDYYVAGVEVNAAGNGIAKVWKNGAELSALTDGTQDAGLSSIAFNGSDYYVTGFEGNYPDGVAKVWKNGVELSVLTDGTKGAYGYSIVLDGSDYYVVGAESNATGNGIAKVWKNGVELLALTDGTQDAYGYSIALMQ